MDEKIAEVRFRKMVFAAQTTTSQHALDALKEFHSLGVDFISILTSALFCCTNPAQSGYTDHAGFETTNPALRQYTRRTSIRPRLRGN